jgi:hypothetical protein
MARVKVKVDRGTGLQQVITVDTEATNGAQLGANLLLPGGAVATPTTFQAWLGTTSNSGSTSSAGGTSLTSVLTTKGDLATRDTSVQRLPIGTNGQTLIVVSGLPAWGVATPSGGGTGFGTFTAGDMLYASGTTAISKLSIGASGRWLGSSGTAPQWNAPAALTKTEDTNVTLTLGGAPATALLNAASLTVGWAGQLAVARGGTSFSTYTVGDVLYASGTGAFSKLGIGSAGQVLTVVSGVPAWVTPSAGSTAALTKTDDTNVTLTLGGSPSTALVNAASIAVGWAGTLAKARGGFGADASALTTSIAELNFVTGVTSAIQTQINGKQASSAVLTSYAGGDTPSAFTLGIVDSVDAAAWRGAIGAGTSSVSISPSALTKTDDTNVTLTLGGTPSTALLQAASIAVGWSGTLAKARGGFGLDASTLTGYVKAAGAGAMTASATIPYSDITGAPAAPPTLADGTYTPTLTSINNIDTLTATACQYMRVGNVVTVSGRFSVDCTAAGVATKFAVSLPISSNFGNDYDLGGVGAAETTTNTIIAIYADATNDRAECRFIPAITAAEFYSFTFTYRVI